jgi:hypothetical protein
MWHVGSNSATVLGMSLIDRDQQAPSEQVQYAIFVSTVLPGEVL